MSENRIELLQGMPVFGAVSEKTLRFILQRIRDLEVAEGGYFFHRGDDTQSFYVLESGSVEVFREHEGCDFRLCELGPGDCFGEMSFIELRNRNASVRALCNCLAIEVPISTLHDLYERDVEQYLIVQMNLARELSRRLREADRRLFEGMVLASEMGGNYWWYLS